MVVYKYTNKKNGKSYVGKSIDIKKRRRDHLRCSINMYDDYPFHKAIRKYGIDGFTFEILCECNSEADLNIKEVYFIKKHDSYIKNNGYNCTYGGDGISGHRHSEYFKSRLSKRMIGNTYTKGHKLTEEHKLKVSLSLKGISRPQCGRKKTEEEKLHLSNVLKNRVFTEVHLENKRISAINTRDNDIYNFVNINKNIKYIGTPYSLTIEHSLDRSSVTKLIKGKIKIHKGWTINRNH